MKGFLTKIFGPKLDPHEQRVLNNIRDHGCQVQWVFDDKGQLPEFTYSIGFPTTVGQPEVLVYGLRQEVMHFMVNEVRRQCAEGLVLADWVVVSGLIEGFDCVLRHVTDQKAIKDHFGWAIWYHRNQRRVEIDEAYQIVWPGAQDGLFPWDNGCSEFVIQVQPPLYQTSLQ
ncbi:MAG: DUF4262 domain-containing protein [Novosphingobium sp.]